MVVGDAVDTYTPYAVDNTALPAEQPKAPAVPPAGAGAFEVEVVVERRLLPTTRHPPSQAQPTERPTTQDGLADRLSSSQEPQELWVELRREQLGES